ncbi:MAG: hypothetical protein OEY49_11990 [Candidatus Heimdallarchaeota archaeon]|nr:hypothetical protein [Candidatus Heimdallarchaeota archaeon]
MGETYLEDPAENELKLMNSPDLQIGPAHVNWEKRVEIELYNIKNYLNFLRRQENSLWFSLAPDRNKKFKFRIWKGTLFVPNRPDISFELRIIFSSDYPKVFPRAFVEESMIKYAGSKLYVESRWDTNEKKSFVMICHEHLKAFDVWSPNLSIAHFLIRQILIWWNSIMHLVVKMWDEHH